MNARWDPELLRDLYRHKDAFPLDEELISRVTPATLSAEAMRFIGMLVLWRRPRHIFECGSGLSTLFLARLQRELGSSAYPSLMSIDHSQRHLGETRRLIGNCPEVFLVHVPLAVAECAGRVFTTYHPAYTRQIPPGITFDLLLIGGPPAYRYGREAPLYHIAPHLSPGAMILLDAAGCRPEQEALCNWRAMWPEGFVVEQFPEVNKGLAVVCIGDPRLRAFPPAQGRRGAADLEREITLLHVERSVLVNDRVH